VHALQSLAVSGFPVFGADTGGFRGTPTSEQLVRWAAHTAFTPVMQIGGGGDSHNPWDTTLFPEPWVLPTMRNLMRLHQQLFPYVYSLVCDATFAPGPPPVLPLGLAFPDDPAAAGDDCAYLFGRRMLVAPGCRGEDPRRVHLPAGTWVDWWTGDVRSGPADIDVANAPGAIPVFLAAGAIVPLLSADVDTMLESTDAATVSASHRAGPDLVRVVPPAPGDTVVWHVGGSSPGQCPGYVGALQSLEVSADADCLTMTTAAAVAPALVLELDWQASSASAPSRVEGASAYAEAASIEGVLGGCGGCWFHDDATGKVYASPVPLRVCR
jgi:hypothetical protein